MTIHMSHVLSYLGLLLNIVRNESTKSHRDNNAYDCADSTGKPCSDASTARQPRGDQDGR